MGQERHPEIRIDGQMKRHGNGGNGKREDCKLDELVAVFDGGFWLKCRTDVNGLAVDVDRAKHWQFQFGHEAFEDSHC